MFIVLLGICTLISICYYGHIFRPFFQTISSNATLWPDISFNYYDDKDNLRIYFLKTPRDIIIGYYIWISDDLLLCYDSYGDDEKIVAFELRHASKLLLVGKPNFIINPIYNEDSNILKINFFNFTPPVIKFKKTEVENIELGMDDAGKVVSLLFYNASNIILETLSEEELVNHEKKIEERRKINQILAEELNEKYRMQDELFKRESQRFADLDEKYRMQDELFKRESQKLADLDEKYRMQDEL